MSFNSEPFENIKSSKKTIEIRLFDEKRQKIHPKDIIVFTKLPDKQGKNSCRSDRIFSILLF